MDNEKYGIELELVTNKFNEKMQQVKNSFSSLTDKKVNLNANTSQINYLKSQINDLTEKIRRIDKGFETGDILKYEAQLERVKNQYDKLITKQNQLKASSNISTSNVVKGLDKMTSKIKRFGLSLLSIRSMYLLVSRASSAYLAQDTELAEKMQSVWAGLGAMLAPMIEAIANLLMKAVKYINIFIKALTGVDLLARASAKSMGATAKSAKALNKALAGFDELQNLDTDAGGGTGGVGGLGAFEDVDINTEWAEKIKDFGEWARNNMPEFLSGLAGILAFLTVANPLIREFGLRLGLIKALGIGVAIAGIVYAIQGLKEFIQDDSFKNFGKVLQGIGAAVLGIGIAFTSIGAIIAGAVILIVGTVVKYWEQIKSFLQSGIDWLKEKSDFIYEMFGGTIGTIYDLVVYDLQLILDWIDTVIKDLKQIFGGVIDFIAGVFTADWERAWKGLTNIFLGVAEIIYKTLDTVLQSIKNKVITIGTTVGNAVSGAFKAVVNAVLRTIESFLNAPIRAINALIGTINTLPGVNLSRLNTFSFPRLAVGTNYVPQDQLAMIHKGEAVIPKKFNSKEYFNGTNDETNAKLDAVIEAIREIEINPYTTIRDVGKASLNYINSKSRQLGESVVI